MYKAIVGLFIVIAPWVTGKAQGCYTLVWADEFSTDGAPNPSNWGYDLGNSGYGNNEIQNYTNTSDNVRIENGILVIEAKKTANAWSSARLKSQGKQSFTYGRIEFRAKLPEGSGTWPALWMLGENIGSAGWPACGEIDVMEHVGKNAGQVHASLHSPSSYGATQNTGITQVAGFASSFHTYAVNWTKDNMEFYVDDQLYYTYTPALKTADNWPFDKPFFMIMNIAMGGNWGSDPKYETGGLKNGIDPALSSVRMEVDYVRYYSITAKPKISGNTIVNKGDTVSFSVPPTPTATYRWNVPVDAQILEGENTSVIKVKWGQASGKVALKIAMSCGDILPDTLLVQVKIVPTGTVFPVSNLNPSNGIVWEVFPSAGNTITLSSIPELEVNYDITATANNPCIRYIFPDMVDLSKYNYVSFIVKTDAGNPPAVLRLDLIDALGNNNQDNLFRVTSFTNDGQFHTYASGIASSATFNLSAIKELKLYINYGIFGKTGAGKIWLQQVSFYKENPLSVCPVKKSQDSFTIYPNPASSEIYIEPFQNISGLKVIDMKGQPFHCHLKSSNSVSIVGFPSGIYQVLITDKDKQLHCLRFIKTSSFYQ